MARRVKPKFRVGQVVFDKEYKTYVRVESRPDEEGWVNVWVKPHEAKSPMQESTLRPLNKREKGE